MDQNSINIIADHVPERLKTPLTRAVTSICDKVTEIVLRADRPLCVYESKRLYFVTEKGYLTDSIHANDLLTVSSKEVDQTVLLLCRYSVYAYQHEINNGYITIGGGVRVGLCGQAVMTDGQVTNVRDISTLCFRVAREVKGCATQLLSMIRPFGGVLICGVPGSGKTTLIRDMARQLSYTCRVSAADERCELSACSYSGGRGFDMGLCDVYAGYPKGVAARQAIRSTAPEIIVCDEIGDRNDAELLMYSLRCGVSFIATVHAASMADLRGRQVTERLIDTGAFRYIVFLKNDTVGKIDRIYEMTDSRG